MVFWKAFNEFTVGFGFGTFTVLYIIVFIKAVPSILSSFKKESSEK